MNNILDDVARRMATIQEEIAKVQRDAQTQASEQAQREQLLAELHAQWADAEKAHHRELAERELAIVRQHEAKAQAADAEAVKLLLKALEARLRGGELRKLERAALDRYLKHCEKAGLQPAVNKVLDAPAYLAHRFDVFERAWKNPTRDLLDRFRKEALMRVERFTVRLP